MGYPYVLEPEKSRFLSTGKKIVFFWNTISTRAVPQCLLYFAKTGIYQTSNDLEVDFALGVLSISLPLLGPEVNTLIGPNMYRLRGKNYVKLEV